jgi:hypothetical protein
VGRKGKQFATSIEKFTPVQQLSTFPTKGLRDLGLFQSSLIPLISLLDSIVFCRGIIPSRPPSQLSLDFYSRLAEFPFSTAATKNSLSSCRVLVQSSRSETQPSRWAAAAAATAAAAGAVVAIHPAESIVSSQTEEVEMEKEKCHDDDDDDGKRKISERKKGEKEKEITQRKQKEERN